MTTAKRAVLLVAVIFLSAASWSRGLIAQATLPVPVQRDSAGIRIVEYPDLAPQPPFMTNAGAIHAMQSSLVRVPAAFAIPAQPLLELGSSEIDSLELDSRSADQTAVQLSNGTIVVGDYARLLYYSANGIFQRSVGRAGRGPGEFDHVTLVCALPGNRVWVTDLGRRTSIWTAEGKLIKASGPTSGERIHVCLKDGASIMRADKPYKTPTEPRFAEFFWRSLDGATVRSLGTHAGVSRAATGFTYPVALPYGSHVLSASGLTYEFRMSDAEGKLLRIVRLGKPALKASENELKEYVNATLALSNDAARKAAMLARVKSASPYYPAYSAVWVDDQQRIWISDYMSLSGWTIFDGTGRMLGRLNLPKSATLISLDKNVLITREVSAEIGTRLKFYRVTPVYAGADRQ